MRIKYSDKAVDQLRKISKSDPKSAERIFEKIEKYVENPGRMRNIKMLKGKYGSFLRLRIGKYRVIFENKDDVMWIYQILHRQEGY